MTHRGRHGTRVALVPGVVLGVALAASGTTQGAASAQADTTAGAVTCARVDAASDPPRLPSTVSSARPGCWPWVRTSTASLGPRRSPSGASGSSPGTRQRAFVRGSCEGVVRLTAHTYPRDGSAAPALGNLLLARLRTGAPLEVSAPAVNGCATGWPDGSRSRPTPRCRATTPRPDRPPGHPGLLRQAPWPGRLEPPHHLVSPSPPLPCPLKDREVTGAVLVWIVESSRVVYDLWVIAKVIAQGAQSAKVQSDLRTG